MCKKKIFLIHSKRSGQQINNGQVKSVCSYDPVSCVFEIILTLTDILPNDHFVYYSVVRQLTRCNGILKLSRSNVSHQEELHSSQLAALLLPTYYRSRLSHTVLSLSLSCSPASRYPAGPSELSTVERDGLSSESVPS